MKYLLTNLGNCDILLIWGYKSFLEVALNIPKPLAFNFKAYLAVPAAWHGSMRMEYNYVL